MLCDISFLTEFWLKSVIYCSKMKYLKWYKQNELELENTDFKI